MRRHLLTFLFVFCGLSSIGQVVGRFYYSKYWQLAKKDSVVFFRICVFDTTNFVFAGEVKDYTKEGKLIMKGTYLGGKKNGDFQFLYNNGNIKAQGKYIDDQRIGIWKYFYLNGILSQEVEFTNDNTFKVLFHNDSTGLPRLKDGNGLWIDEYWIFSFPRKIIVKGHFKSYQKDGEWTSGLEDGTILVTEKYRNGKFIKGSSFDLTGAKLGENQEPTNNQLLPPYNLLVTENFLFVEGVTQDDYPILAKKLPPKPKVQSLDVGWDETFTVVEESAFPENGMMAFYKEISAIIQYPAMARRKGIEGKVFVEFIINADGSLSNFEVIKGIGGGCDEEAIRVITESTKRCKWKPGKQKGRPVRQRYTLPIMFRLG